MADITIPEALLRKVLMSGLEDVKNLQLPLLRFLARRHRDCYQSSVKWQARVDPASAGTASTDADAGVATSDGNVAAALDIDAYRFEQTTSVKYQDMREAMAIGTAPLNNLLSQKVGGATENLLILMSQQMYEGTGNEASGGMVGLTQAVKAGGNYAGINAATYTGWKSRVDANGGTARPLTKALMRTVSTEITSKGGNYDVIFADPAVCDEYEAMFDSDYQVQVQGQDILQTFGTNLFFKGRRIVADPDCQDGLMYYLNSRKAELHTRSFQGTVKEPSTGLNILVKELPSNNPNAMKISVSCIAQIACKSRRDFGLIEDIQVAA